MIQINHIKDYNEYRSMVNAILDRAIFEYKANTVIETNYTCIMMENNAQLMSLLQQFFEPLVLDRVRHDHNTLFYVHSTRLFITTELTNED